MSLSNTLDKRITLKKLSVERDAAGQPGAEGWLNLITEGDGKIWAGIKDLSGKELIAASAVQSQVQTVITIRFREDVHAGMRVEYSADVYTIQAVTSQDRRKLQLLCMRGVQ